MKLHNDDVGQVRFGLFLFTVGASCALIAIAAVVRLVAEILACL